MDTTECCLSQPRGWSLNHYSIPLSHRGRQKEEGKKERKKENAQSFPGGTRSPVCACASDERESAILYVI